MTTTGEIMNTHTTNLRDEYQPTEKEVSPELAAFLEDIRLLRASGLLK